MHPIAILHEVQQLYNVSDRLDSLAGQHPLVSEALITISGSVRNTATLLMNDATRDLRMLHK